MRILLAVVPALLATASVLAQDGINPFAQPIATTVQLPTFGVSFDATAVLQLKTFTDPSGRLIAQRAAAARAALPGNLGRPAQLRKVSIVRLQHALSAASRDGRQPEPPVPMTTFAAALSSAGNHALERWWFTPAYDAVHASPDRLAMQLAGQGVQLQTENKAILGDGTISDAVLKPTRATRAFATSFTKRYDDIAGASPIYAQLRQLMDFLIVAAYIRQHDWYAKANWRPAELLDENVYPVNTLAMPVSAPVVVNAFWKRQRMFTPAGGGVSIEAEQAIAELIDDPSLTDTRETNRPGAGITQWWWD